MNNNSCSNERDFDKVEGYPDPTAGEAIRKIEDADARFHKLLSTIFNLVDLAGFRLGERIVLVDKDSGLTWR